MDCTALIQALTDPRGDAQRPPTPDDELRALLCISGLCRELCTSIARHSGNSPTRAVLFNLVVEAAHKALDYAQLQAAQAAQLSLVQELPAETFTALRIIVEQPDGFLAGGAALPGDPRTVPQGRLVFKDTAEFLQRTLDITHFEAKDRLKAASCLLPGRDLYGNPMGPRYPKLAEQVRSGAARLGPTAAAARKLEKLRPGIQKQPDPASRVAEVEKEVARSIREETPRNTGRLFDALNDQLEQQTGAPGVEEIRSKTGIFITKRTRNFTYMSLCLLNIDAEVFLSHFAQSDNPRTNAGNRQAMADAASNPSESTAGSWAATEGPDWASPATTGDHADGPARNGTLDFGAGYRDQFNSANPDADGLTPPQRHLQTLLNLMRAPSNRGDVGATGLPTARLVVYVYLETLLGLAKGSGWSAHGLEIPIGELRRRLSESGAIPVVLGGQSEVLDVGRERRFAPDYMKRAVLARDGGCIYPGCTVPPEHCEFNHIEGWSEGGATSVENLVSDCTQHHHMFHTGELRIIMHNGLPHVLLPEYLDREQKPRRNTYWQGPRPTLF